MGLFNRLYFYGYALKISDFSKSEMPVAIYSIPDNFPRMGTLRSRSIHQKLGQQ